LKCAIRGCSGEDSCLGRGLDRCYTDVDPEFQELPYEITGLPISPSTIVYYYTYGSVLAALSRPADNQCGEAMKVLGEVRTELNANPDAYADGSQTIISIVDAGEAICQSLAGDGAPVSSVATDAGGATPEDVTATPNP